ncbi:hypothetical protein [Streptomyces sp. NBC_00057]|uniref:hypothetical protein n=1 Tax=Streptomyces sp. NBC_00057 TaxID=2975634 RepID=UPI00324C79E2
MLQREAGVGIPGAGQQLGSDDGSQRRAALPGGRGPAPSSSISELRLALPRWDLLPESIDSTLSSSSSEASPSTVSASRSGSFLTGAGQVGEDQRVQLAGRLPARACGGLADRTAAGVQHAPITPAPPRRSWPTDLRARRKAADDTRRNQLALRQSRNPRRWRYTGQRTAPLSALWLLAPAQGIRGPCRPLTDEEQRQIDVVAVSARAIERALDIGDGQVRLAELCPICDGPSTST